MKMKLIMSIILASITSLTFAVQIPDVKTVGLAGPYQQGLVILNLQDYKNVPDIVVIAKCDPDGINMSSKPGLYKTMDEPEKIAGPYQEALIVIKLKDFSKYNNIKVIGKCSPIGISMTMTPSM